MAINNYCVKNSTRNYRGKRNHRLTHGIRFAPSGLGLHKPPVGRALRRWNALCVGLFRHILQALQTLRVCLFGLAKRRIPFRVMRNVP
jgi:hypothetical protein